MAKQNTQLNQLYSKIEWDWDCVLIKGNTIYIYDTSILCFTITQNNKHFIVNSEPLNITITLTTIEDVITYMDLAWYKIFDTVIPDNAKL